MQKKSFEYAATILSAIQDMLNDEDNENYISLKELSEGDNLTEFIHGLANLVPTSIFNSLTNQDKSNLEFNHLANQLVFQFSKLEETRTKTK